jgi:aminopeptidase N
VRILLENPLLHGEITVVELEFAGVIPVDRGSRSGVYGTFNYDSAAEVLVLANGYPILATWEERGWRADPVVGIGDAVVSDVAVYHARISAPPGWQVVATGTRLPEPSGGSPSWTFASGPVREFMLVGSPNFVEDQAQVDGVQVHHWGLPDGEGGWDAALQAAVDSISLFDEQFGLYPYQELDVVAVPLWLAAGVEYPGLILLRQGLYSSGLDGPLGLEYVAAHEVAHQWWYGVVGSDVLEHPWQDEALATYSALLYQEEYQPFAYPGTLLSFRRRVADLEAGGEDTRVAQPVEAFQENPGAYSPVVYVKGSLIFDDLRERLGDEAFFEALQAYYAQNVYVLAPPQTLLAAFERACACSLDPVYQEWGVD